MRRFFVCADLFTDRALRIILQFDPFRPKDRKMSSVRPPLPENRLYVFPQKLSWKVLEITSACCSGVSLMKFTAYPETRIVS